MALVQERLLPKVELGPRLDAQFERLRRALQDAVAAHDPEALAATRELKDGLLQQLAAARASVDPTEANRLKQAVDDYYGAAANVSRRLLGGETGEALVDAMANMQAQHTRTIEALKAVTTFDRRELTNAFAAATRAQTTAGQVRFIVSLVCLTAMILLSAWLSRGVLRSVAVVTAGLKRFAHGDFERPITGAGDDEFGEVGRQANQMAESLKQLAAERDRTDWLKNGQAGLSRELRGELEPEEVAARTVRFVARYLDAHAGALYYTDRERTLTLLGQYALSPLPSADAAGAPRFRPGEGLVGQAALQDDLMIVGDPPENYLRIRSGLGEAGPRVIALLPILYAGQVSGVLELGLFSPWAARSGELLLALRETVAIALEVARARAATRQLLSETQRQAQRLSSQEEELRANNEELQTQQEELRQTNEELTQQAEELETQRRELEERNDELDGARRELERKAAELTTVSAYKSQFLANMSHELRTPLNSMLLLSNLLATNGEGNLTDKQVEYSSTIYAAGRDLLALINQVLDLARIEAGKYEIRVAPLALRDLVGALERVFLPLARDKGLRLATEVAATVPASISTDRQRVEQILNNLLANAIKFTPRGEVTLAIRRPDPDVTFRRDDLRPDHTVALVVSDTGLGIAAGDQERIFAPFEQVDAAPDRRYGGTGLGLNIAKELANLLGGELQLRSAPGQGSTFICYLPERHPSIAETPAAGALLAAEPDPGAPTPPAGPPANPTAPTSERALRPDRRAAPRETSLLIIEDDPHFAEALSDIIEAQGMKARVARDGQSGLRLARDKAQRPDAIILDVMLPDVDGWAVLKELRADPATATIPVHIVSAVDAADHGAALGVVGYLTKPATRQDLARMVQSLAPASTRRLRRILVIEDPAPRGPSLTTQLAHEPLDLQTAKSAREALERLAVERFACMILDLTLPDMDGLAFLRAARVQCGADIPPVVVYASRALTKAEAQTLEAHSEAVVLNEGSSTERLREELRLFVRRLDEGSGARRPGSARLHPADLQLKGRKILIVDDDMRTVYALSAMLRAKGVDVTVADTGHAALAVLDRQPEMEAVLMDIMMPEMDGYEAMRRIRRDGRFGALPIIALTAKAMKGDQEKCLEAGASAYLPKPIDPERLVTLLHSSLAGAVGEEAPRGD
jgi:CheY-like chemotaxis protein/Skp family chaperone for outer membrane proteins